MRLPKDDRWEMLEESRTTYTLPSPYVTGVDEGHLWWNWVLIDEEWIADHAAELMEGSDTTSFKCLLEAMVWTEDQNAAIIAEIKKDRP